MKQVLSGLMLLAGFAGAQVWMTRAPIPTPRWDAASVVLDGNVYVIGGQDSAAPWRSIPTVEAYDPAGDTWVSRCPMNFDRWGLAVVVVAGRIYAIGGRRGAAGSGHDPTGVVEEYDPLADTWFVKDSMPTPRGYCGCAVFCDTVFVLGGRRGNSQILRTVEKYCPASDTWIADTPMPNERYTFATATVGNKAYLVGGWNVSLVEEFDFETRQWTTKAPMPTARGTAGVGVYSGRILVVGGRGGRSNELECYLPEQDTWLVFDTMPTPREGLVAAVVGDTLYTVTGSKPLNQGGLPYYGNNEAATGLLGLGEVCQAQPVRVRGRLAQPSRARFVLSYTLDRAGQVNIAVYDAAGRVARRLCVGREDAGHHELAWDGTTASGRKAGSGAYLWRVDVDGNMAMLKCVITN